MFIISANAHVGSGQSQGIANEVMGMVINCVCDFVVLSFRALRGKWFELSILVGTHILH